MKQLEDVVENYKDDGKQLDLYWLDQVQIMADPFGGVVIQVEAAPQYCVDDRGGDFEFER